MIREKVGGWGLIKNLFSHGFKGTKEKLMNGQRNVEYRKKVLKELPCCDRLKT